MGGFLIDPQSQTSRTCPESFSQGDGGKRKGGEKKSRGGVTRSLAIIRQGMWNGDDVCVTEKKDTKETGMNSTVNK